MVTVREKINNIKRVGKFYDFPMPYEPKSQVTTSHQ